MDYDDSVQQGWHEARASCDSPAQSPILNLITAHPHTGMEGRAAGTRLTQEEEEGSRLSPPHMG